jgi:cytochrome c peroxidase
MKTSSVVFRRGAGLLLLAGCLLTINGVLSSASAQAQQTPAEGSAAIPLGLPGDTWDYYVPRHNPQTAVKVALGHRLFFDTRLSADGTVACATCHKPELAFTDGKAVAEGIAGRRGARNSPTLLNVIYNPGHFWDGRSDTLEEQAIQPLINPLEMGDQTHAAIVARLGQMPEYAREFSQVFHQPLSIELVGQALAAYERTLLSGAAPIDHYLAGESGAISEAAQRGLALFRGKARCSRCHVFSERNPFFSNFDYVNTGVAAKHPNFASMERRIYEAVAQPDEVKRLIDKLSQEAGGAELGRLALTYHILDLGAYRTPSLRNVALTAPYFHDGSAATLADVVRFYNDGGIDNLNREWDLRPLGLTEDEQQDLVEFLKTLTGKPPETAKLAAK